MKRPSGGRGEYEIAEGFGALGPRDLLDRELRVQLGRLGPFTTGVVVRERQGKLRLRIEGPSGTAHIHRQIAASVLLPKPTRSEAGLVGGSPVIFLNRYELRVIRFASVTARPGTAVILLGAMEAANGGDTSRQVDFGERVQRLERLQNEVERLPEPVAAALTQHQRLLEARQPLTQEAENAVELLMTLCQAHGSSRGVAYAYGTDVLPALEALAGLPPLIPLPRPPRENVLPPEGPVGEEYRPADEEVGVAEIDPFPVDPAVRERGLRGHASTQNALAAWVSARNLDPRSPRGGEPNFDLAWEADGRIFVAEVKSMTLGNEERQLRFGLGQVLRYRHILGRHGKEVVGVLAVEKRPEDRSWEQLCQDLGVLLVWPDNLEALERVISEPS